MEILTAAVNATTNGDNTLVAASSDGERIRILGCALVADAAVGIAFEDGAGGTEIIGQAALAANGGYVLPLSPNPNLVHWGETSADTLLNLETDAAANVRGVIVYALV